MQRYFDVVQDRSGNCVPGAFVYVYNANGQLATIYSDNGVTQKANPTTTNVDGEYTFFAANGRYSITINSPGYGAESRDGIILFDPQDNTNIEISYTPGVNSLLTATSVSTALNSLSDRATGASVVGFKQASASTVNRTVQSKLREAISILDFGAVGNGVTDDTAAFTLAANSGAGLVIYVPPGTYMVDTVVINTQQHWRLAPNAIVKMRSAYAGIRAVFDFLSGADGSTFIGGVIDGNRDALASQFLDADWNWTGVRAFLVDDFLMADVTIQNVVALGFWLEGDRVQAHNLRVKSCGKGSQIKRVYNGAFTDIVFDDIGSTGVVGLPGPPPDQYGVYQHCNEWRNLEDVSFTGIVVRNFKPDTRGREPTPCAIIFERSIGVTMSNVMVDGFTGTSISGGNIAVAADTVTNFAFSTVTVIGYFIGFSFNSCTHGTLDGPSLDGKNFSNAGHGIVLRNSGITFNNTGDLGFEARNPMPTSDVTISGGTICGFGRGILIQAHRISVTGVRIYANAADGINVDRVIIEGQMPTGSPVWHYGQNIAISNCDVFNNGRAGILLEDWGQVYIHNCRSYNNGQDTAVYTTAAQRIGVGTYSSTGFLNTVSVTNCFLGDTQSFTNTKAASFVPGSTVANEFTLYLNDYTNLEIGQWITLVNAAGGSDITAKIKYIDPINATTLVSTSTAATFSDTGNLTTLTGIFSSSGTTLTGVGSLLSTELRPYTVIKANGEYRLIRRINSNTEAVISAAFTTPLSSATVQVLGVNVAGIPCQQHGERWNDNIVAGGVYTRDNRYDGVLSSPVNSGGYTQYAPGSEVTVSTAVAGVNVNTGGAITTLIGGIPATWTPLSWRTNITTSLSGLTTETLNYEFRDSVVGLHTSLTTSTTYVAGTKTRGDINAVMFTGTGSLAVRVTGGVNPSGGAIRGEALFRVPRLASY